MSTILINCREEKQVVPFDNLATAYDYFLATVVLPYVSTHPRHYRSVMYLTGNELLERFKYQIQISDKSKMSLVLEQSNLLQDLIRINDAKTKEKLLDRLNQMSLSS